MTRALPRTGGPCAFPCGDNPCSKRAWRPALSFAGIYHHVSGGMAGGHAVKFVGWGVDGGVKYWKVANSWNPCVQSLTATPFSVCVNSWARSGRFCVLRRAHAPHGSVGWAWPKLTKSKRLS